VLLKLTTVRRLALVAFVFLTWTPAAYAWSWPMQGPVLQPFAYDEAHPYAAGQHRGVDIGADAAGEAVVAPAAGTVSFAGTVPTNGKSVTIETADGYSVTLTHLGSISVSKGTTVAELGAIGTVGPSGTPEVDAPYVHLGIRVTADPNGYRDPLTFLPAVPASDSSAPPTTSTGSAAAPAKKPASSTSRGSRVATARGSHAQSGQRRARVREEQRPQESHSDTRTTRSGHRPVIRAEESTDLHTQQHLANEPTAAIRRSLVEPTGLGAVHWISSHTPLVRPLLGSLLGLVCNAAAALCAIGAALAASRRRRSWRESASAGVLHLPRPVGAGRQVSRAA
jgi:hypothetical protein